MSQKYGLQLACFFPGLLLCPQFTMEADVLWGKGNQRLLLEVSDSNHLTSHYRDDGHYVCEEGKWLEERWVQLKMPWTLTREGPPINLGGKAVIVPDYTLRSPDGREAYLEIVGFWRKNYLQTRLELIRSLGPTNLILAVSERLRVSEDELSDLPAKVFLYKGTITAKELLALAESCALSTKTPDTPQTAPAPQIKVEKGSSETIQETISLPPPKESKRKKKESEPKPKKKKSEETAATKESK